MMSDFNMVIIEEFVKLQEPKTLKHKFRLKRCPCCGNRPRLIVYLKDDISRFRDKFAVQCKYTGGVKGCGLEAQNNAHVEAAVAAWNQRV